MSLTKSQAKGKEGQLSFPRGKELPGCVCMSCLKYEVARQRQSEQVTYIIHTPRTVLFHDICITYILGLIKLAQIFQHHGKNEAGFCSALDIFCFQSQLRMMDGLVKNNIDTLFGRTDEPWAGQGMFLHDRR